MKKIILPFLFLIPVIVLSQELKLKTPADTVAKSNFRFADYESTSNTVILTKSLIQKLGGSATGLISRIAGVTMLSGSLTSFRGLSPRYTTFTIDGLTSPVTQQNIKAFALGLLPGSSVQELKTFKSGNYTNQGEWGGAYVNIVTDAGIEKNFNKVSLALGYQYNVTFKNFLKESNFGSTTGDYFGYGVKTRDFTQDIAGRVELQNMSRNESALEGRKMQNTWALSNSNAIPNIGFGYSMGRILKKTDKLLFSTINSVNYSRAMVGMDLYKYRYTGYKRNDAGEVISSETESYMTDGVYQTKTTMNYNSAWHFKFNPDNEINADIVYSNSGTNGVMSRYMVDLSNNKDVYFYQYGLKAKSLILTRLTGDHNINNQNNIKWSVGYNYFKRDEPDLKRAGAQRNLNQPEYPYLLIIAESSKADNGARFNSKLYDNGFSGRVDYTFNFPENNVDIKAGIISENLIRTFDARILTNVKDDFTKPELRFVEMDKLGVIFEPGNFGPEGYYLVDGTTDFDTYDAFSSLIGGYAGFDNSFGEKWKISIGLRGENFHQELTSGDVSVQNTSFVIMPFIDANFLANSRLSVKFGYSQTVNRPAFRELAPFTFYDFDYRADIQGNPDLQNATIHNIDIGALYLINNNDYASVSFFYKNIQNPIEMIYIIRSELPLFSFDNADRAQLMGVELDLLKVLSQDPNNFLSRFLFNGTLTLTKSAISLGEETNEAASTRPLQGQIPITSSMGVTYLSKKKKTQITLNYKYRGKSLYSVGDGQETFPWYDKPVNLLNIGFAYLFRNNIKISIMGLNLLNAPYIQVEDANLNGKLNDDIDKEVQYGLTYQSYNLTVSYKF